VEQGDSPSPDIFAIKRTYDVDASNISYSRGGRRMKMYKKDVEDWPLHLPYVLNEYECGNDGFYWRKKAKIDWYKTSWCSNCHTTTTTAATSTSNTATTSLHGMTCDEK
jgi:hypothetical protein